jgi:hypothetical protein
MNNTLWGLRAAPNKKSNFSRVNFMPKMQNLKDPQFLGPYVPRMVASDQKVAFHKMFLK